MILTDTHTHLYSSKFDSDRDEMIQRALDAGVTRLFLPNVDAATIPGMLDLVARYPQHCFPMMGLHPCHVKEDVEQELETVRRWLFEKVDSAGNKQAVNFSAVGEIGLDYYWELTFKEQQKEALRQQTQWEAHQRTGQNGNGDHEALFSGRQVERFTDEGCHGAVEHPDGKREIEVQERCEKRRGMARPQKGLEVVHE